MRQALFAGLVIDENDRPAETGYIGSEPCYILDDAGFFRHIPAEQVDRQVLAHIRSLIRGHEGVISEQTARMLGQDDPFSRAMMESQLKNIDQQFNALLDMGIPEEMCAFMGMSGFKVVVDFRGEVLEVRQAGAVSGDEGE